MQPLKFPIQLPSSATASQPDCSHFNGHCNVPAVPPKNMPHAPPPAHRKGVAIPAPGAPQTAPLWPKAGLVRTDRRPEPPDFYAATAISTGSEIAMSSSTGESTGTRI